MRSDPYALEPFASHGLPILNSLGKPQAPFVTHVRFQTREDWLAGELPQFLDAQDLARRDLAIDW